MSGRRIKYPNNKVVAKLVTDNRKPCVFCQQDIDDEVVFGKLYSLGDIQCHYFCVLLSCCLVQKAKDTEGLYGFLYKDIMAEVERSKKHKCSYCGRGGANLGCCITQCRKQFHLPCGRQKNAISLFYGNYKSYCEMHAPKQKISDDVMVNAKVRMKIDRMLKAGKKFIDTEQEEPASVCVICYEEVHGYPTTQTFWPPCCGRDAWLHRSCLQRMALSAGMHYIKCPLCNDKQQFYEAVCKQGYYLPDRDAAWELEQNAFAEMYERPTNCGAVDCKCPFGRKHDEPGIWDIKLCLLCGSCGVHAHCGGAERLICAACRPAAADIEQLETRLAHLIQAEQERETHSATSGPVMPSRMSLRSTKSNLAHRASSSSRNPTTLAPEIKTEIQSPKKELTRLELNLKTPKRPKFIEPSILKEIDNKLLSPIKMLEQSYLEKLGGMEGMVVNSSELIEKMRAKLKKPKPLSEKKRIVNEILDDLFKNVFKESLKGKELVKEWNSPKKCIEITETCYEGVKENVETDGTSDPVECTSKVEEDPENLSVGNSVDSVKEHDYQNDKAIKNKENVQTGDVNVENNDGDNNRVATNDSTANRNDSEIDHDESSNSTFDLLPEFIAERNDSLPVFDTPKKLKPVDIEQNSRLEISEQDEVVNIDLTADRNDSEIDHDESSKSTFDLPPEFIAESDDSLPIFDTPKKLKTVDIEQNTSLEISEQDEVVNIDMVEIGSGKEEFIKKVDVISPNKNMCSLKFSPVDRETLQPSNIDVDIDSFKDHYLNEVDREFKCIFNHNHLNNRDPSNLRSVIDFAVDATRINRKRKLESKAVGGKKRKMKLKYKLEIESENRDSDKARKTVNKMKEHKDRSRKSDKDRKKVTKFKEHKDQNRKSDKERKRVKKIKKLKDPNPDRNIRMKIKWKDENKPKSKTKEFKNKFQQYVLKFSSKQKNRVEQVLVKPEKDFTPMKRKYVKQEKSPDSLMQTSILSFFKTL